MGKIKCHLATDATEVASNDAKDPPHPGHLFSTPSRLLAVSCLRQMATIYQEILHTELARQEQLPERIDWLNAEIGRLTLQARSLRADDAAQIFEIYGDYKRLLQL